MHTVAWQSVPAGQGGNSSVLQPAEPVFRSDPECAVLSGSQVVHTTASQPLGCCVRGLDPVAAVIGDAAEKETEPQTTARGIRGHRSAGIVMTEFGPWDLLDHTLTTYLKKTGMLVSDPQISSNVLCDTSGYSRHVGYRNKAVIFKVAESKRS